MKTADRRNRRNKERCLARLYDFYNRKYFGGKLPRLTMRWDEGAVDSELASTIFMDDCPVMINFMAKGMDTEKRIRRVLLHEMVHVSLPPGVRHGKRWKVGMRRLAARGALDEIW